MVRTSLLSLIDDLIHREIQYSVECNQITVQIDVNSDVEGLYKNEDFDKSYSLANQMKCMLNGALTYAKYVQIDQHQPFSIKKKTYRRP